jgi:hypothetical protein
MKIQSQYKGIAGIVITMTGPALCIYMCSMYPTYCIAWITAGILCGIGGIITIVLSLLEA